MKRTERITLLLTALAVLAAPLCAMAGQRPAIERTRVYVADRLIVSDVECARLFTEQVVGTVESGLPTMVELLYNLTRDGKSVRRGVHAYELRYDVWDDVYSIDRGDTTLTFASFTSMRRVVERLRRVPIARIGDVESGSVYAIEFSIAVHPLRGGEKERIVGWVDDTVRGKSEGSWHEQVLNLNNLIHRFFSRDKDPGNRSEWVRSVMFTPSSLPLAREEIGG